MNNNCNKCLLYEAGGSVTLAEIEAYIKTLNSDDLVSEELAAERLSYCKKCEYLISGMCRKCGCYVEVRARLKKSDCPDYDNRKW